MQELEYPFDEKTILRRRKKLRVQLLQEPRERLPLRIAILSGSTTDLAAELLELFLLNEGIAPVFYQGGYGRYFEDAVFENPELAAFSPDLIWFHTGSVNLDRWPDCTMDEAAVRQLLSEQTARLHTMWKGAQRYGCRIIQNNYEMPLIRLLGNMDGTSVFGRTRYIHRLNEAMVQYASEHQNFHIHDVCYLSADCGLQTWYDPGQWYQGKMCPGLNAVPILAHSLAKLISSIFLGSKKVVITDLDNTLWDGIVAETGPAGLNMARENAVGEAHLDYQKWLLSLRELGVMLCAVSKNDETDAISGLNSPDCLLRPEDFAFLAANWKPKNENIRNLCQQLNIFPDACVFIDDSDAERELVRSNLNGIHVPQFQGIENLLPVLSRRLMFQMESVTQEDRLRAAAYRSNLELERQREKYESYDDFLRDLDLRLTLKQVEEAQIPRAVQLIGKTNRFNLSGIRYSAEQLQRMLTKEQDRLIWGARLTDRLTDHGMICYIICRFRDETALIEQWVMSCRCFLRGVEHAVMGRLAEVCRDRGVKRIVADYVPTEKNAMMTKILTEYGFSQATENGKWVLPLERYTPRDHHIRINGERG